uniref:Uncharacterized protein n=1 Tax=Nannospalax galili TaxID=1026970 RepID=A0A8C6W4T0_NANGA
MCCFSSQQFFGQVSNRLTLYSKSFIILFFLIFPVWPGSYKQPLSWPDGQSPGPQFQQNPVLKVPLSAFLPEASMLCLSFFLQILLLLAQDTGPSPAHV